MFKNRFDEVCYFIGISQTFHNYKMVYKQQGDTNSQPFNFCPYIFQNAKNLHFQAFPSITLCYACFNQSDWLLKNFRPIRMLKTKHFINLHNKLYLQHYSLRSFSHQCANSSTGSPWTHTKASLPKQPYQSSEIIVCKGIEPTSIVVLTTYCDKDVVDFSLNRFDVDRHPVLFLVPEHLKTRFDKVTNLQIRL